MKPSESQMLQLRDQVIGLPEPDRSTTACIGFDRFVDTIQRAVRRQHFPHLRDDAASEIQES